MTFFSRTLGILSLILSLVPVGAQAAPFSNSAQVVTVDGVPSLKPVHPGADFSVAVEVTVASGWHVNAHEGLPQFFIPIELSQGPNFPGKITAVRYPAGDKKTLSVSNQAFSVYEGKETIVADVKLNPKIRVGSTNLPLLLRAQACDDKVCLAPGTVSFQVPLEVAGPDQVSAPFHPELFEAAPVPTDVPENIISEYLAKNGFVLTLLLIFLGGLALNLTPCVYPMIPLTISYFGSQKSEKPTVVLGRAVAYVVGISLTYSTLGVTAALTGKILGSTLQSPFVLIGISLVLVTLSLSMFGLYEIQAPAWLLNKVAAGNTQGWVGALGMGLVFGIVAAPCVDPFSIGLLTFVAAKANPYLGFLLFFILSLGLGFPYLWLGFFSSNLQKLPRSGTWMVWVKKVFGLVLFGMPLYFLGPLLPGHFNRFAVPGYLVVCGLLLGMVFSGGGVSLGFKRFQRVFGIFLVVIGLFVFRAWPQPVELVFQPYDAAVLEEAQKDKKPVLVDFSASWCIPCKELDLKTFPDPRVREAFQGWVLLKADLTEYSSGPVEQLKKTYGIMGVPTLVFIGADGKEKRESRVEGFVSADQILPKIEQVPTQ